jgi:hypothetical protein
MHIMNEKSPMLRSETKSEQDDKSIPATTMAQFAAKAALIAAAMRHTKRANFILNEYAMNGKF